MKLELKRPCVNCPFRNDVAPYLTTAFVKQLSVELTDRQKSFSCHKTIEHDDEGTLLPDENDNEQHCAGALILLEKLGRPNQIMRWMERIGGYDPTELDMTAPVYDSFKDMLKAYQARDMASKRRSKARS